MGFVSVPMRSDGEVVNIQWKACMGSHRFPCYPTSSNRIPIGHFCRLVTQKETESGKNPKFCANFSRCMCNYFGPESHKRRHEIMPSPDIKRTGIQKQVIECKKSVYKLRVGFINDVAILGRKVTRLHAKQMQNSFKVLTQVSNKATMTIL